MRRMLRNFFQKTCRRLDISALYRTETGIKCHNQLLASAHFKHFETGPVFSLPPSELRIGFDGLKDPLSLLGVALPDSPHYQLAALLEAGADISRSEYVQRVARGTLDFRPAKKITGTRLENFRRHHATATAAIRAGQHPPVAVITGAGRHYVADGKHRAALCALLQAPVRCVDVSPLVHDSFFRWVHRKMRRQPAQYEKHLGWFDVFYTHDETQH